MAFCKERVVVLIHVNIAKSFFLLSHKSLPTTYAASIIAKEGEVSPIGISVSNNVGPPSLHSNDSIDAKFE